MGCWNETCGISNIPITFEEPVVVVPLVKQNHTDVRCYTTALYKPVLLPFYGLYNDYGASEENMGAGLPIILSELNHELIEMEVGENQFHDTEVKRAGFTVEKFFEAVKNNRLFVKDFQNNQTAPVSFMMIRKKIFNYILNNYVCETWALGGSRTTYMFKDVLGDISEWIDSYKEMLKDNRYFARLDISRSFNEKNKTNLVAYFLSYDTVRYHTFINYNRIITMLAEAGDDLTLKSFVEEMIKVIFIDHFMMHVHKMWLPQIGSQEFNIEAYRLLVDATTMLLDEEERKRNEE